MKLCLVFGSSKTFITPAGGCTPSKLRILKSSVTLFCNNDTGVSLQLALCFLPAGPKLSFCFWKHLGLIINHQGRPQHWQIGCQVFSNVGSKLVAAEFANAWEAQSVCRGRRGSVGNNFTLLGNGNTDHSWSGWNQSSAGQLNYVN